MSDSRNDFEMWEELMDKHAHGEALSADEDAFFERFVSEHPECGEEVEVYAQLSDLQAAPDAGSRALVDAALARMERDEANREVQEADAFRKRRVPVFALVTGVLAVAATVAMFVRPSSKPQDKELARAPMAVPMARAELVYASGVVNVEGRSARVGKTLLAEGSAIETALGSACVVIDPEINVCLSEHSKLTLTSITTGARRLVLDSGTAAVRLATQPEGMSLSIVAGDVVSTAVGTAFSVQRSAQDDKVTTTVLNGKVRVGREHKESRIVAAHERSEVSRAHSTLIAVSRTEEAPSWALLGPTVLWHDPVAATLEIHGEPGRAEAFLDDQPIGIAPLSTLVPVGEHHVVVKANGQVLFDDRVRVNAGDSRSIEYRLAAKAPDTVPADAPKLVPHARKSMEQNAKVLTAEELRLPAEALAPQNASQMLSSARKLIREGRYADAAKTYVEIRAAFPNSAEAHTVLVSLGQLELSQLDDPGRALTDLNKYLEQGGALSEEARVARISALRALNRAGDEARAIEEFLQKHPRSFEAGKLRARLSQLRPAQ